MTEEAQRDIIEFLSRPQSHGLAGPVERITTHASIVFLVGDRALKLKRAVRLPYLDFSSVERRRKACAVELRLNRRTAPEIYEAVRSVNRLPDGSLAFDADGPAVDWVVAMRRFDQAMLFDRMAERGALARPLLAQLVEHIVAFHRAAEPKPKRGGAAGIEEVVAINERSLIAAGFPAAAVRDLISATNDRLRQLAGLLDRRRAEGKVRHCHGDLHLGNICLFAGRPTLFDCIEFSESLAAIDVLYDIAFLLMDLGHRELGDFANFVFNRYVDATAEEAGIAALPLFLSLRAAVRAHVGAIRTPTRAGEPPASEPQSYFAFARRLLVPVLPTLVAVGGLSGTGKSTVAAALAPALGIFPGARILRTDVLRKRALGLPLDQRLPPQSYTPEAASRVYAELLDLTQQLLRAGHSVILDAVAARPTERADFAAAARKLGVPFHGLWLEAPPTILERRVGRRTGDPSDATAEVVRLQLGYDLGEIDWRRIDAGADLATVVAAARAALA